jgi:TP901 family phage tail tape measure protein
MADINPNIEINIDTSSAMASIKALQSQISVFHQSLRASGDASSIQKSNNYSKNLVNSINATGKFSASLATVAKDTNTFSNALERNKLSMAETFKYGAASSGKFGRLFKTEFATIEKVTRERVKTLQTQFVKLGSDANGAIETIKVRPLRLDMDSLATQTAINSQKQQIFNKLLKQGSTNLLNFGKNTQWAGRQLMVGFTLPLAVFGTVAGKAFMEMEEAVIKFRRVYGELNTTVSETDSMVNSIEQLAKSFTKYGIAIKDTMNLAADAAAMGKMGADLTAQVAEATRLAVLGGVDQAKALETTISLTNALGVSTEDLASKIDFLNAVENQTVTAIEDLTIAIPKAGPIIQQLGGSVEDLAFFLTAMKEGGINASEGANALKSGLASLINPAGKAVEMLQGFGINVNAIVEGNAGNVKNTVIEFAQALDTLDPLNRARAIEQMFGKFQFARISTLFKNVVDEGTQAGRVLQLTRATTEELAILSQRELQRVEDSPGYKFKKQIEDIKNELVPLGREFLKLITPIIEFASGLLKQFNSMDEGVKTFVMGLIGVLGLIAPTVIMSIGLLANGFANIIKGFGMVNNLFGRIAGVSTSAAGAMNYFTQEQLEAAAVGASLGQIHSNLVQVFSLEKGAVNALAVAYRQAAAAAGIFASVPMVPRVSSPIITKSSTGRRASSPGGVLPPTIPGYAKGILSLPGRKGAGDILPAMLAPGEAVIPAKQSQKYSAFLQAIMNDEVPGFAKGVMLGMPGSGKSTSKNRDAGQQVYESFLQSSYRNVPPTNYGHQLSPTSGHSFPIFGLGGVYMAPDGKKVFVKPVVDENSANAEMRGTQIARQVHGLKAPEQKITVIADPNDPTRTRRFLALESKLDSTFINNDPMALFNEPQYFQQLVASLLRVDKDLSAGNVFGNTVADVGPAGVFKRASGVRAFEPNLPSMEEQATINLLGIKGGAKRAFAESTLGLMAGMTPQQYHQKMITEIQQVLPLLKKTVAGFGLTNPQEADSYQNMIKRLESGLGVNWSRFHTMHSAVKVAKPRQSTKPIPGFADGVLSVPGPKGAGDVIPAMLSPGEAVIPADKAKKYRGFISSLIAGNVPGFELGTGNVGGVAQRAKEIMDYENPRRRSAVKSSGMIDQAGGDSKAFVLDLAEAGVSAKNSMKILSEAADLAKNGLDKFKDYVATVQKAIVEAPKNKRGLVKSSEDVVSDVRSKTGFNPNNQGGAFTHVGPPAELTAAEILEKNKAKELALSPAQIKNLQSMDPSKSIGVKSGLGMSNFDQETNRQLDKGGADVSRFSEAFDEAGLEKWNDSIRFGGGDVKELASQAQILDQEFRKLVSALPEGTKVFDTDAKRQDYETATGKAGASVESMYGTAKGQANAKGAAKLTGVLDVAQATPTEIRDTGTSPGKKRRALGPKMKELPVTPAKDSISDTSMYTDKTVSEMEAKGQDLYTLARDRNSPHRQAGPDGEDDAKAYNKGFNSSSAKGRSTPPPSLEASEKLKQSSTLPDSFHAAMGVSQFEPPKEAKKEIKSAIGGMFREMSGSVKNQAKTKAKELGEKMIMPFAKHLAKGTGNILVSEHQKENLNYDSDTGVTTSQETGQVLSDEAGFDAANIATDEQGNPILTQNGDPMTREAYGKGIKKQASAMKRQRMAGKAFGALSVATMGAGMMSGQEGPVGDVARQVMPILGALSMIGPMLLALAAPIAILVGVVGLVAFGLFKYNQELNKVRKESRELGESLASGSKAMDRFAQFAGTVSPTEIMNQRRAGLGTQVTEVLGKSEFASNFIASDQGKELVKTVEDGLKTLGRSDTMSRVSNQLAMAVATGMLTQEQASNIALELGKTIEDYNFTMGVVGELQELLGPNGEKLLEGEPLDLFISMSKNSAKSFSNTVKNAMESLTTGEGLMSMLGFEEEAIISFTAGALTGMLEEQQMLLDGLAVAQQKSIDKTLEEAKALEASGKVQQANAKFAEAELLRDSQLSDRVLMQKQYSVELEKSLGLLEASDKNSKYSGMSKQQIQDDIVAERVASGQPEDILGASIIAEGLVQDAFGDIDNYAQRALESMTQGIKDRFAEAAPEIKQAISGALGLIQSGDELTVNAKLVLTSAIGSGALDPEQVAMLVKMFDPNVAEDAKQLEILANVGLSGAGLGGMQQVGNAVSSLVAGIEDEAEKKKKTIDLLSFIDLQVKENPEMANQFLDLVSTLGTYSDFAGGENMIEYIVKLDEKSLKTIMSKLSNMQGLVDRATEPITVQTLIEQKIITDQSAITAFMNDQEYFQKLDPVQQFLYVQTFLSTVATVTPEGAEAALRSRGVKATGSFRSPGGRMAGQAPLRAFSEQQINDEVNRQATNFGYKATNTAGAFTADPKDSENTGGGGSKSDPFENILNRLKQVRDASINAAGGVKELMKFLGGKKSITIFDGMDQQMLLKGYNSEFRSFVTSLDEAARGEFATFEKGVLKVTAAGKAMNKAFSEATLGDYQISLSQGLADVNMQIRAMTKLTDAGMSNKDAFEVLADANLAYAISMAATTKEVKQLIKDFNALAAAKKELANSTVEGMEAEVSEAFSKINEFFSAKEQAVTLKFEADAKSLTNVTDGVIALAQKEIQDYQYTIDDLSYELDLLVEKETEINDKYDKRIKALDKVQEINQSILDQQSSQLSVSEALSSGDIAAAARAVQELRAKQASSRKESFSKDLDLSRERELESLRSTSGKSRLQLEREMKDIQAQIAIIEETRLEPAQRSLSILERARDVALEAIGEKGYLGKTKAEWALVENGIRLAKVEAEGYGTAILAALALLEKLRAAYSAPQVTAPPASAPASAPAPTNNSGSSTGSPPRNTGTPTNNTPAGHTPNTGPTGVYGNNISGFINNQERERTPLVPPKPVVVAKPVANGSDTRFEYMKPKPITVAKPKPVANGSDTRFENMKPKPITVAKPPPPKVGQPRFMSSGGKVLKTMGTDSVPAMLTPGEFVVKRSSVNSYGLDKLKAINNGQAQSPNSVYNYSLTVNTQNGSNPDDIARTVMSSLKRVESQRIRSSRY